MSGGGCGRPSAWEAQAEEAPRLGKKSFFARGPSRRVEPSDRTHTTAPVNETPVELIYAHSSWEVRACPCVVCPVEAAHWEQNETTHPLRPTFPLCAVTVKQSEVGRARGQRASNKSLTQARRTGCLRAVYYNRRVYVNAAVQQSAAKRGTTTVSRSNIRVIQHLDSSAHGLVRRWL